MTTIDLNSQIYRDILIRSQTINNIINDLNDLNDFDNNINIDTISLIKNFDTELEYLKQELIYGIDLSKRDDYIKILIDRLGFFVYLDMNEEIDIKPLAKFIGESIETNLYEYVGDLININNEYIGYIDYDTLYLIVENYSILHIYKELEDFAITEAFYNEIYNNIPRYVSLWYHIHQQEFLEDYKKYISNKYYSIIHEYNILFYIKYSNEFMVKYLLDNENYDENKKITFYDKIVTNNNNPYLILTSNSVSKTLEMKYWYIRFYEYYCSFAKLNIMLYIRNLCLNYNITPNENTLLENSVKNSNYPIVKYILNNLSYDTRYYFILKMIKESAEQIDTNYSQTFKIIKLLVKIFNKYHHNFKLHEELYYPLNEYLYTIFISIKGHKILLKFLLDNLYIDKNLITDIFNIYVYYSLVDNLQILLPYGVDINNHDTKNLYIRRKLNIGEGLHPLMILANSEADDDNVLNTANFLISKGANIEDYSGYYNPLIYASNKNRTRLAKFYVDNGADINSHELNSQNSEDQSVFQGNTALRYTIINNNFELLKYFIDNGADLNNINNRYLVHTAISRIVELKSNKSTVDIIIKMVKYLIQKGANTSSRNFYEGDYPLVIATQLAGKYNDLIIYLLKYADNNFDSIMHLYLSVAGQYNQIDLVKYLIDNNVLDVNIADNDGITGLICASMYGNLEIAKFLLDRGADIHMKTKDGKTALISLSIGLKFYIYKQKYLELANILLNLGSDDINDVLLEASKNNLPELITFLLDKGANINYRDKFGNTAIYNAVSSNVRRDIYVKNGIKFETVSLLLDRGADIKYHKDILTKATHSNDIKIIKLLLEHGADPNFENNEGLTPLISTIANTPNISTKSIVELLLNQGVDINYQNKNGDTALMYFCRRPTKVNDDIMKYILSKGADINLTNKNGENAMIIIFKNNSDEVYFDEFFKYVFKYQPEKLNIDYKDEFGNNLLMLSLQYSNDNYVYFFIENGIDIYHKNIYGDNAFIIGAGHNLYPDSIDYFLKKNKNFLYDKNNDGNTALMMATLDNNGNIIDYLLEIDPRIMYEKNNDGNNALMLSCTHDELIIVRTFVERFPQIIYERNNRGDNAFIIASEYGQLDIVQYLLERNQNFLYDKNNDGNTALMLASLNGHLNIIEFLVENDPTIIYEKNDNGETPLTLAYKYNHLNIINFLLHIDPNLLYNTD